MLIVKLSACSPEPQVPETGVEIGRSEGEVHVGADLASGDLFVHAESEASLPTAQAGGEAQIGDTLSFNGVSSLNPTTTLTMTGTMSNSNGFTAGSLEIFDDIGLLTAGGLASPALATPGIGRRDKPPLGALEQASRFGAGSRQSRSAHVNA